MSESLHKISSEIQLAEIADRSSSVSSRPECCDECASFSGDGMNECCQHPDYVDDGMNMNARPGRCRMIGCQMEVRDDER